MSTAYAGKWVDADDERFDARLRYALLSTRFSWARRGQPRNGLNTRPKMFHRFASNALGDTGCESDPFRDWLETLPAWDNVSRIDTLLSSMFGAEDDALTRWASRYIGIGAVQRAYEPGWQAG